MLEVLYVSGTCVAIGVRLFFFQAEDGIRDLVRSRGLGDVYKRQENIIEVNGLERVFGQNRAVDGMTFHVKQGEVFGPVSYTHLTLPTSDLV